MTRIEYLTQVMLKLRLWEVAEDKRTRSRDGKIAARESFTTTDLHIILTAAQQGNASVTRDDFDLGNLVPNRHRIERAATALERLERLGYLRSQKYPLPNNKTITRYFITDTGVNFTNTIIS